MKMLGITEKQFSNELSPQMVERLMFITNAENKAQEFKNRSAQIRQR